MNIITAPLTGSFRNTLGSPSLRLFEKQEWGAQNADHRTLMRSFLVQISKTPQESDEALRIADLSIPLTRLGDRFCSITHSKEAGLIALDSHPIGIDYEFNQRVQARIVERIAASPKELSRMPNPAALWCAKEAAFKALRHFKQPEVLSQIEIGGWRATDDAILFFEIKNAEDFCAPQGQGALFQNEICSLAVFRFSS